MKNRNVGIMLSYVYTALNMVVGLFLSAFLLRILGDTEYGIYKTVSSFANMLVLFEFGTGTVMTRNLTICFAKNADQNEIERNISTVWTITNVLAGVILIASLGFFMALGGIYQNSMTAEQIHYGQYIFIFVTIHLILSFYSQTLGGVILAYEYYPYRSVVSIAQLISRVILLVALLSKYKYAILIAMVDAGIIMATTAFSFYFCRKKCGVAFSFRQFDYGIFKQILPLSLAIFLQVIVNQANSNVDNFLIGIKLNPESVALYSVAMYVYSIFSSLTTIPISMYAPQVLKNVARGMRGKELTDSMVQPCRLVMLTGGGILFGFISAGHPFIELIYGKEYILAWSIALIIMVPMMVNMCNGVLINVLDALNKRMARSKVLIATTVINIILTIVWLNQWGVVGAAVATAVATVLGQIIIMNIYYAKVIGIHVLYLFRRTFDGILPYQILGAVIALALGSFINNVFLKFIISGIVFVVIFCTGYLCFGADEYEKKMLHSILNKFRTGKNKCRG